VKYQSTSSGTKRRGVQKQAKESRSESSARKKKEARKKDKRTDRANARKCKECKSAFPRLKKKKSGSTEMKKQIERRSSKNWTRPAGKCDVSFSSLDAAFWGGVEEYQKERKKRTRSGSPKSLKKDMKDFSLFSLSAVLSYFPPLAADRARAYFCPFRRFGINNKNKNTSSTDVHSPATDLRAYPGIQGDSSKSLVGMDGPSALGRSVGVVCGSVSQRLGVWSRPKVEMGGAWKPSPIKVLGGIWRSFVFLDLSFSLLRFFFFSCFCFLIGAEVPNSDSVTVTGRCVPFSVECREKETTNQIMKLILSRCIYRDQDVCFSGLWEKYWPLVVWRWTPASGNLHGG
jgi:hypothetical protein